MGLMLDAIGVDGVLQNLDAFNLRTQRRIKVAVKESADYTADIAKQLCPVSQDGSHGNPPGTLRDGIAVRVAGTGGPAVFGSASETAYGSGSFGEAFNAPIPGGAVFEVFDPVFYAAFQELGTKYMAAQPFLTPAFQMGRVVLLKKLTEIALV